MGTNNDVVAALLVIFVIRATINVRINTITHGGSEDIIVSLSPMADDKPDAYRKRKYSILEARKVTMENFTKQISCLIYNIVSIINA